MSYEKNNFELPYRLNHKKTMRGLERRFSQREAPQFRLKEGQIVKTSWTPDFSNIFSALEKSILGEAEEGSQLLVDGAVKRKLSKMLQNSIRFLLKHFGYQSTELLDFSRIITE